MAKKSAPKSKRSAARRSLRDVVRPPRRDRVGELANALAKICNELVAVGLGPVNLGKLAKHMLKLRRSNPAICRADEATK